MNLRVKFLLDFDVPIILTSLEECFGAFAFCFGFSAILAATECFIAIETLAFFSFHSFLCADFNVKHSWTNGLEIVRMCAIFHCFSFWKMGQLLSSHMRWFHFIHLLDLAQWIFDFLANIAKVWCDTFLRTNNGFHAFHTLQ